MEKLFFAINAESYISRTFLRNMDLYANRYMDRDSDNKWIMKYELTAKIWKHIKTI